MQIPGDLHSHYTLYYSSPDPTSTHKPTDSPVSCLRHSFSPDSPVSCLRHSFSRRLFIGATRRQRRPAPISSLSHCISCALSAQLHTLHGIAVLRHVESHTPHRAPYMLASVAVRARELHVCIYISGCGERELHTVYACMCVYVSGSSQARAAWMCISHHTRCLPDA